MPAFASFLSASRFRAPLLAGLSLAAAALPSSIRASDTAATPPPPKVTVAPVESRVLTEYEEITGRVDAVETVELRARVSGHLDEVRFQAGALVNKGDVLFAIDPRWYKAQADLARAQVEQARARSDIAAREAKRADDLLSSSAISSEEAEARRSRARESIAALASAEAQLATAQLDLDYTQVRAPISGRVSRALVTAGNLVSGSPGNATLLTTIVSTGDAFVYADVDENTLLKFRRLQRENRLLTKEGRIPVELQLADESGYPRQGFLESTDNRLNSETGSLLVRLVFSNADGALLPGLFARVRIPISAPQPTLLISDRSIGTDQSQKYVFAVGENNTVVYRTVKLGAVVEGKRVVRAGVQSGDRIVINGLQRVRPGMTVTPEVLATTTSVDAPATPDAAPATAEEATKVARR